MAAKFKRKRLKAESLPKLKINTGREGQQSLSANPISREVLLKAGFTSDQSSKDVLGSDD